MTTKRERRTAYHEAGHAVAEALIEHRTIGERKLRALIRRSL